METNPLVSIVIPTFNRKPSLISNSITSALEQTYRNIEIIIVDDSSDDFDDREKVKEYIESINDSRIRYIQHSKNLGANIARNTGIKNSRGEICAFLDDDDGWTINKIELQVNKMIESNAALIYCKGKIFDDNNNFIKIINNELYKGFVFDLLIQRNFIGGNSFVMIRKSVFYSIGFFDDNMLSNQDWELFLRISKKYRIDYVDEYLVNYYVHSFSNISSNPRKKLQGWTYLIDLYQDYLNMNPDIRNYWNLNLISIYLKNRKYDKFILVLLKTFFYSPLDFIFYIKNAYKIKYYKR